MAEQEDSEATAFGKDATRPDLSPKGKAQSGRDGDEKTSFDLVDAQTHADFENQQSAPYGGFDGVSVPVKPGATFGRYELLEQIDVGGMGVIYKARHIALRKTVALKLMTPHIQHSAHGSERFEREMQAIGCLEPHPNVINAYDAGSEQGFQYIATELIDGVQLWELVQRVGALSVSECCRIVSQAALGINHLASHSLVHRDIKPNNLMLTRDGVVKLVDLGLALLRDEHSDQLTVNGETMGSIDYMAPEQWDDPHNVDFRTDIYGLGCTFFCLLSGRPPFSDQPKGSASRMRAHLNAPFPDISSIRADVPVEAIKILNQMVVKDPNARLSDLGYIAERLDVIGAGDLKGLVSRCFSPASQEPREFPKPRRQGVLNSDDLEAPTVSAVYGLQDSRQRIKLDEKRRSLVLIAILIIFFALAVKSQFWKPRNKVDVPSQAQVLESQDVSEDKGDERPSEEKIAVGPTVPPAIEFQSYESKVMQVAFLGRSGRLVSISETGVLCIFDAQTPEEPVHRVSIGEGSDFGYDLDYNPTNETLAVVTRGTIEIRSAEDLSLVASHHDSAGFTSVTWIPSTNSFVTGDWDGEVRRFEASPESITDELLHRRGDAVFDVDVSSDGSFMIWAGQKPTLTVFDCDQQTDTDLPGYTKWLYDVSISANDKLIAGAGHEGFVRVWSMPKQEFIGQFPHTVPQTVEISDDGQYLVVGDRDSSVHVWHIDSKALVQEYSAGSPVNAMAISSDFRWIATGCDDGSVRLTPVVIDQ